MSRKIFPPGMKISFCVGRSAPPDSTRLIVGSRFSWAICAARNDFFSVHGLLAPPFTVGSLATIMHSTPSTTPMPVTMLAPTVKSEPQPASGISSRNADPSSSEQLDPLAGQQLAALLVALVVLLAAAGDRLGVLGVQLRQLGEHRLPARSALGHRGHEVNPSSFAARSSSTSLAPPPMPRIRASR